MKFILIVALFGLPVAEIITFIEIGGALGLEVTLGIVVLTAFIGVVQLRLQGLATFYKVIECLNQGRFPVDEAFDGCCLILASIMLLTPGFITDCTGILLYAPLFRAILRRLLTPYIFTASYFHSKNSNIHNTPPTHQGTIFEGEYDDVTPTQEQKDPLSTSTPKIRKH